jgi:hypothetical protein
MDNSRPKAILDPLKVLPTELWSEILYYAVSKDEDVVPNLALVLSSVSTVWLHAIVSTPFLWTTIVLDDTENRDLHAITAASLHLSRDRPLTVILRNLGEDSDDILARIAAHSDRIEAFRLEVPTSYSVPLRDAINRRGREAVHALGVMPNLLRLHWWPLDGFMTASDFVQEKQCFQLQTIVGISLTRAEIMSGLFRNLQTINTFAEMESIFSDLRQMPSLEHVKIGNAFVVQPYKTHHSDDPNQYPNQYPKELEEFRWKSLQWSDVGNPLFTKVLRACSNLQTLNIGVNWQDLPVLLSGLAYSTRLQALKLIIRLPANRQFQSPPLPPNPHLKRLEIIFLARPWRGAEEQPSSLFRVLAVWAYNVEYLSMRLSTSDLAPFKYIESLHNLRSLKLITKNASVINEWTPNLNSGTLCEVELTAPSTLRKIFATPSTRSLTLTSSTVPGPIDELIEPRSDQTANVTSLSLHKFLFNSKTFTALRKLTIEGHRYASRHLMTMIASPSQCPLLEEFCIQDTPEWDLVFLMLERRNIRPHISVSPIRALTVPVLPGPSIMKPLVALLGCRSIARPSNTELSSQGFRDIFFDFNLYVRSVIFIVIVY